MKIGERSISKIFGALFVKAHYVAISNMPFVYGAFFENLYRYLTARGDYPYKPLVHTPIGDITPILYSYHDLLTLNEIFCRHDYKSSDNIKTVVDFGSNIGISALYFLTRNKNSRCYLFEPDPRNVSKLHKNLQNYKDRYILQEKAIGLEEGRFSFSIEETGRYGGLGLDTGDTIQVDVLELNKVLSQIISERGNIDIVKFDIEGLEIECVKNIRPDLLDKINVIYLEAQPTEKLQASKFSQFQYNAVCMLKNRRPF